jgi:hypothetical protein
MPFSKLSGYFSSSDKTERAKALAAALAAGTAGDKDAMHARPDAVPAHAIVPGDPGVPIPAPASSPAGAAVVDLLAGGVLTGDDLRRLVATEEARLAAIAAERERQRAAALETAEKRAERERMAAEYAKLAPEFDALTREVAEAAAQFADQRDALLQLAGAINGLVTQHSRLFGMVQGVTPREPGEFRAWERPWRWSEVRDGITLRHLELARTA